MIDKLRDEIMESQKARTDLIKWKLILVAVIGSAGLGLGSNTPLRNNLGILLALIPFVCLYVDAVCFHNDIRIMTIARFIRTSSSEAVERAYEEYCTRYRSHFSLEGFALLGATVGLSALMFFIGRSDRLQRLIGLYTDSKPDIQANNFVSTGDVLAWSGCIGVVAGVLFYCLYRYRTYKLDQP